MLVNSGVPSESDVKSVTPSQERLEKGPVAIIECFQKIPCNPCSKACPRGAITIIEDINNIPELDYDQCNGCAICVANCPGLAIFVVDNNYSETEAVVKLPWELFPLPQAGQEVTAVDRAGEAIGKARVLKVQDGKFFDRTRIVHLVVPKEQAMLVRSFTIGGETSER